MSTEPFDPGWYLLVHGDVEDAGMSAEDHHERHGRHEGRSGAPPPLPHQNEREFRGRWDFFIRAFSALMHNGISGDYVEFGTGRGSTLWCAARAGEATLPRHMWGFDSFAGLPSAASALDEHPAWQAGTFANPLFATRARLARAGVDMGAVTFVEGFYAETLHPDRRAGLPTDIALAYVDCDLHSSTLDELDYLTGVLKHGMLIAFDDLYCWSPEHLSGEETALAQWERTLEHHRLHRYLPIGWHGQSFYVSGVD